VTGLGDARDRKPPWCAWALDKAFHCLLVCTPEAPPQLDERIAFWQARDGMATCARRPGHGRFPALSRYRFLHDVSLLDGPEALSGPGCESTVVNATTGAHLSPQSCITHHRVTVENVAEMAPAGRGRWKSENENNPVLKTQGDHVEHHFGHGTQSLAAVLLSLHLLAWLCHTV
jgi:hypothetical protein